VKITKVTTCTGSEVKEYKDRKVVRPFTLVKIDTDEGISGVGEGTLETKEKTVATCIMEFERYLIGKDPLQIEKHWQAMYKGTYWRGGPVINSAISAIEIALWDIAGKYFNTPICNLLGGRCRDKIRCYAGVGMESRTACSTQLQRLRGDAKPSAKE